MQSDSTAAIAKALSAAQGQMGHAIKDAENPAFKRGNKASTYADLSMVIDALRGPFAQHGLSFSQVIVDHETRAVVDTVLLHESGEWISSRISLPVAAQTPHAFGSAYTYARRFALAAIAGVAQADDDGNAASAVTVAPSPVAPVVDEGRMLNYIAGVESADSLASLSDLYYAALKVVGDDQAAQKRIIAATNKRKRELQAKGISA